MPKNRIHKLEDGRYRYQVTDSFGKRRQINSRENERLPSFRKRCERLDLEAENATPDLTFDALFQKWHREHVVRTLSLSEQAKTLRFYRDYVKPYISTKKLGEIARQDVYQILLRADERQLSSSSLASIRGIISRPFNWAINTLGLDLQSPTTGMVFRQTRKPPREVRVISESDLRRFFAAAENTKYYHYYKLLECTGLRPSECLGLKRSDFTKTHIRIERGMTRDGLSDLKTSAARRTIPLTNKIKNIIRELPQSGWLFPTSNGKPSMSALNSAFKRTLKQTAVYERGGRNGQKKLKVITPSVDFTLYDFRHTFATRMAEANVSPSALAKIMGHTDVSITMEYYIGVTDAMMDKAIEAMDLL